MDKIDDIEAQESQRPLNDNNSILNDSNGNIQDIKEDD